MYKLLSSRLQNDFDINDEDLSLILPYFTNFRINKKELLLQSGEINKYLYFVNSGSIRSFFLSENGIDATRNIFVEHQFCMILNSFADQSPAAESMQAIENSELLRISFNDFTGLLKKLPSWEKFYRLKLERSKKLDAQRIESFIIMNARQRYSQLLKYNPKYVKRFSNSLIASYLGVTQESLSRLKKIKA